MSLRLLLLRHGETAWNRERRYQGWTDTPLSAEGLLQAEAAARELKEHAFAAVYASPLQGRYSITLLHTGAYTTQGVPVVSLSVT